jgi:hypothetical protein
MVPRYTDISHFRAPYKESMFLQGFGQNEGAIDPEVGMEAFVETDEAGNYRWKPKVVEALKQKLKSMAALAQTEDVVGVALPPDEAARQEMLKLPHSFVASEWVKKKLAEGKVVFADYGLVFPPATSGRLAAVPKKDAEAIKMTSYVAPILEVPGLGSMLMGLGAGGLLLIGLAGGGLYLATRKKRRAPAVPNRRRRRRRRRYA